MAEKIVKMAFFDVDGVLSAPHYNVDGKMQIGFPTVEGWIKYCETRKDNTYDECKPVPAVYDHARKLKEHGAKLYVLTASFGEAESHSKQVFVERCYEGLFDEFYSVLSSSDKVPFIQKLADENGVDISECELVEDTFTTLLEAEGAGIIPTHIANLVEG